MKKPWELVPTFTESRLIELARRVVKIRFDALLDHRPEKGDGAWGLGTRVYERMIKGLSWASITLDPQREPELPWLTVRLQGLFISLKIGGWPIRIYRGDPNNPTSNVLRSGQLDVLEQPALPGMKKDVGEWFWVMVVETVLHGTPISVTVQQANEAGETRNQWRVPFDLAAIEMEVAAEAAAKSAQSNVATMAKAPVEVGKAEVAPKRGRRASGDERD